MSEIIKISYVEIPVTDIAVSKSFYADAFGWEFQDYGPSYAAITNAGLDGGLDADSELEPSGQGSMIIMWADDLEANLARVKAAGGKLAKDIFSFPGGRRFEFHDPDGNRLAVFSSPDEE